MSVTCRLLKLKVCPQHGVSSGDVTIIKDVAVGWEAWCCSSLCPTRSCMDVLEISPDCWGVMLSHSNNYSSWMNCSGHGVQLVKTLVAHTAGR